MSSSAIIQFQPRPSPSNFGSPVPLETNYYKLESVRKEVFKYSIKIEPEPTQDSKLIGQILKLAKEELTSQLNFYIAFKSNIYSYDMCVNQIQIKVELDQQDYILQVQFSKVIKDDDSELFCFYAIFFKTLMRKMTFE